MISAKELCEAMSECGLAYRSYSGRGMYGKECVGFTTDTEILDCVELALQLIDAFDGESRESAVIRKLFRGARTDSMGRSTIVYFPGVEWDDSEPTEDEEE